MGSKDILNALKKKDPNFATLDAKSQQKVADALSNDPVKLQKALMRDPGFAGLSSKHQQNVVSSLVQEKGFWGGVKTVAHNAKVGFQKGVVGVSNRFANMAEKELEKQTATGNVLPGMYQLASGVKGFAEQSKKDLAKSDSPTNQMKYKPTNKVTGFVSGLANFGGEFTAEAMSTGGGLKAMGESSEIALSKLGSKAAPKIVTTAEKIAPKVTKTVQKIATKTPETTKKIVTQTAKTSGKAASNAFGQGITYSAMTGSDPLKTPLEFAVAGGILAAPFGGLKGAVEAFAGKPKLQVKPEVKSNVVSIDKTKKVQPIQEHPLTNLINELQQTKDQIYNEHLEYLQRTNGGKGVTKGGIIREIDPGAQNGVGEVVGAFPKISNNEFWYQDFYSKYGRKPTKTELKELAHEHLTNGIGEIPANAEYIELHNMINQAKAELNQPLEAFNAGLNPKQVLEMTKEHLAISDNIKGSSSKGKDLLAPFTSPHNSQKTLHNIAEKQFRRSERHMRLIVDPLEKAIDRLKKNEVTELRDLIAERNELGVEIPPSYANKSAKIKKIYDIYARAKRISKDYIYPEKHEVFDQKGDAVKTFSKLKDAKKYFNRAKKKNPSLAGVRTIGNENLGLEGHVAHVFNNYRVLNKKGEIINTFKRKVDAYDFYKKHKDTLDLKEVKEADFKLPETTGSPDQIRNAIMNMGKQKFLGNKLKRLGVEGYDKDFIKTELDYLRRVADWEAKNKLKAKAVTYLKSRYGMTKIPEGSIADLANTLNSSPKLWVKAVGKNGKTFRVANKNAQRLAERDFAYVRDVLGVPTGIERKANDVLNNKYIRGGLERIFGVESQRPYKETLGTAAETNSGLLLSGPIKVLTQTGTLINTYVKLMQQYGEIKGTKYFLQSLAKLPEFIKTDVLNTLRKNPKFEKLLGKGKKGFTEFIDSTLGETNGLLEKGNKDKKGLLAKLNNKVLKYTSSPFSYGDLTTRRLSVAAKLIAEIDGKLGKGKKFVELPKAERAKAVNILRAAAKESFKFNNEVSFNYAPYDTASVFRGPVKRLVLQFVPYAQKQIEFILKLPRKQQIEAVGLMMLLFGKGGIPLANQGIQILDYFLENVWNTNTEEQVSKLPKGLQDAYRYGLSGQTGLELTNSMGWAGLINNNAQSGRIVDLFPTLNVANKTISGVGSTIWGAAKGDKKETLDGLKDTASVMPWGRRLIDAGEGMTKGYISRKDKPYIESSTKDVIANSLGAISTNQADAYKQEAVEKIQRKRKEADFKKLFPKMFKVWTAMDEKNFDKLIQFGIEKGIFENQEDAVKQFKNAVAAYNKPPKLLDKRQKAVIEKMFKAYNANDEESFDKLIQTAGKGIFVTPEQVVNAFKAALKEKEGD